MFIFVAIIHEKLNHMKRIYFVLLALLAFGLNLKAQQYVSTEPANRNVILEEFTGRGCGYCTDGHRIANQIMASNPGRVWAINIHAGGYAQTSYPNMITTDGNTIHGGFSISGYPCGVVNRTTSSALDRGQWSGQANTQLNQASECNIAGVARVNPATKVATITVEVYYTGNSSVAENYLTVAMLQDSILGSQSDYGNYNPTQWLNGQYVHMHILRDVITPSAWGEAISPTTAGTLITKTYEYQIPETIGSPNGVDVVLDHIFFLAWVSQSQQGSATRPILTACELQKTTITDEPIYPAMTSVSQEIVAACTREKNFEFGFSNIGTETLTSVKFTAQVEDAVRFFEWTGELPSGEATKMGFSLEIPYGTYEGTLNITEANGEPYESSISFNAESPEWAVVNEEGETTDIKIYIIQDQFGEQITWELLNSAGDIVASGGPYQHIIGSGTQVNVANVNDLAVNDCYLFRLYDSNNNGICCNYGQGYYYFKDAHGNRFIEGSGDYGSEARELFSIQNSSWEVETVVKETLKVYPNPANEYLMVEGEMNSIEVYNAIGQCLMTRTVDGNSTCISLAGFNNGIYFIRVNNNGEVTTRKFSVNR